jgi:hypothetical protein
MGVATKEQVAVAARLLALNLARDQIKYGELPLRDSEATMRVQVPYEEMQAIRRRGIQSLAWCWGPEMIYTRSGKGSPHLECPECRVSGLSMT